MSEVKHTPGPWEYTRTFSFVHPCQISVGDYVLAQVGEEADARLIVAAPDLLDALKVIRNTIGDVRKGFSPAVDPERWVEQAQAYADAVIAKAEGRS